MPELEDEPYKIPENFRVSVNKTDAKAFRRLLDSDEFQQQLAEKFQIKAETPKERERRRAFITINTLRQQKLSADQKEQLAEAYATLGEYEIAAKISKNKDRKSEYNAISKAVWLPDDEWCEHIEAKKYIKEYVFSVKEGKEMPLLACAVCRTLNVTDSPESLKNAQNKRAAIVRNIPKGLSIDEAKRWHQQNVK